MNELTLVDVAVIMSVYKNDKLTQLKTAIDSIQNQEYGPPLLYIYVDGLIPNEISIYLNNLILNSKIIVIRNENNKGLSHALNHLINIISNIDDIKYIARMDSDDISYSNRLILQKKFMENNLSVDVLGSACEEFGGSCILKEKKPPINHEDLVEFSIIRCPFIHPTVMFRKNIFLDGNRYPVDTHLTEDMAFWLELISKGYILHNLSDILLKYRLEDNTIKRRLGYKKAKSEFSLRIKYMFILKKTSLKNLFFILSRFIFHMLPASLLFIAYRHLR